MRTLTTVPIGTKIKLTKKDEDFEEEDTFKVIQVYTHHVVCQNKRGIRRSVTNAELYTRGMVQPEMPMKETVQLPAKGKR